MRLREGEGRGEKATHMTLPHLHTPPLPPLPSGNFPTQQTLYAYYLPLSLSLSLSLSLPPPSLSLSSNNNFPNLDTETLSYYVQRDKERPAIFFLLSSTPLPKKKQTFFGILLFKRLCVCVGVFAHATHVCNSSFYWNLPPFAKIHIRYSGLRLQRHPPEQTVLRTGVFLYLKYLGKKLEPPLFFKKVFLCLVLL